MIVQTAPEGSEHLVYTQVEHARAAARLAQAFGNDQFTPLDPAEHLIYVTKHHDDGWLDLDAQWLQDPNTGLPYHLVKTPLDKLVRTGKGSPDVCEQQHPFCGVISSMHTYGLYHGRYGLSNFVFIDLMPEELQSYVEEILANELARQARLKQQLPPEWASEQFLFHHYKLLQFFDTLALYFQTTHAEARTEAQFHNVPRAVGDDVTLTIRPIGDSTYSLNPYPFQKSETVIVTHGRLMSPQPIGTDLTSVAKNAEQVSSVYFITR